MNSSPKLRQYAQPVAKLSPELAPERLIRPGEAAAIRGVNTATIYRLVKAGKLPRPRRLSHRVSGWRASEILPLLHGEAAVS